MTRERFAKYLAHDSGIDWHRTLKSYDWKGTNWAEGVFARLLYHDGLVEALDSGDRGRFDRKANAIGYWGGMKPLSESILDRLWETCPTMRDGSMVDPSQLPGERVATYTKVYAMLNPMAWTIYDSRVGFALQRLAASCYGPDEGLPEEVTFRIPPRKGKSVDAPDPRAGRLNYAAGGRIAFLNASYLLRDVAKQLNETSRRPPHEVRQERSTGQDWQVYHVEMALFMLGKDAGDDSE